MSAPNGHDREPDPAALDELSRAFGTGSEAVAPEAGPPVTAPVGRDEPDDPDGPAPIDEFDEFDDDASDGLRIVEQTAPEPADEATPPTIIRIDDISGSIHVRGADDPSPEPEPPARAGEVDDGADVVVIGGDDDLPDAVYVEGSLDRSTNRSIVFIEDDAEDDAVQAESGRDASRGIEPRMRERRVAVKRAQSRKRLKWVALGAVVVIVVVGGLAVLGSPLFAVRADQVTITGAVYTDREQLDAIVDDLVGTPSLRVDTTRLEEELEAISWVDEARVTVDFPHAATIDIRERAAMTTYRGPDERFRVLDREGRVLDVLDLYPFAYLLIEGPDPVDLEAGQFAPRGYAAASELAKNLTATVRGRIRYVEVTADGSRLVMHLQDGSTVFFGEARDLFAKLVRLETVLGANPDREPGPIDVSTADVTL